MQQRKTNSRASARLIRNRQHAKQKRRRLAQNRHVVVARLSRQSSNSAIGSYRESDVGGVSLTAGQTQAYAWRESDGTTKILIKETQRNQRNDYELDQDIAAILERLFSNGALPDQVLVEYATRDDVNQMEEKLLSVDGALRDRIEFFKKDRLDLKRSRDSDDRNDDDSSDDEPQDTDLERVQKKKRLDEPGDDRADDFMDISEEGNDNNMDIREEGNDNNIDIRKRADSEGDDDPINDSDDSKDEDFEDEGEGEGKDEDELELEREIDPPFPLEYQEFLSQSKKPLFPIDNSKYVKPLKQISTTKQFKPKGKEALTRKPKDGPVLIDLEEVSHVSGQPFKRPTRVRGKVVPVATKGRPSAPEPSSGFRVSQSTAGNTNPDFSVRNTGRADAQKGHIMALELGGPDIPENIVPQWAQWQSNGVWRQMERQVLKIAKADKKNDIYFDAKVKYREDTNLWTASYTNILFPVGFVVTIERYNKKTKEKVGDIEIVFDQEQSQDRTDNKLFIRVVQKLNDNEALWKDWNPKAKKGRGDFKKTKR